MTQACGEIAVMFQSDPDLVRILATSEDSAVRQKAVRVLKLLVGEDICAVEYPSSAAAPAATNTRTTGQVPAAAAPPLLDLLQDEPAAPSSAVPPAAASAVDLLADLSIDASPATQQAKPALASQSTAGDMFGGLNVSGASTTGVHQSSPAFSGSAASASQRNVSPMDSLLDFGNTDLSSAQPPAVPPSTQASVAGHPANGANAAASMDMFGFGMAAPPSSAAPTSGFAMPAPAGGYASVNTSMPQPPAYLNQAAAGTGAPFGFPPTGSHLAPAAAPGAAAPMRPSLATITPSGTNDMFDFVSAEFGKKS